jgi:hypothetical protein
VKPQTISLINEDRTRAAPISGTAMHANHRARRELNRGWRLGKFFRQLFFAADDGPFFCPGKGSSESPHILILPGGGISSRLAP